MILPSADAQRERERELCTRWTELTHRDRERCARAGTARPCAHVAVTAIIRNQIRFGRFFEGKKMPKWVWNVAKLAILGISISSTMDRATGQTENTRCVNHVLIKLVPLKFICVNMLLIETWFSSSVYFFVQLIEHYQLFLNHRHWHYIQVCIICDKQCFWYVQNELCTCLCAHVHLCIQLVFSVSPCPLSFIKQSWTWERQISGELSAGVRTVL